MADQIKMFIVITGFVENPETISRMLQIQPSQTWVKGELIDKTKIRRKSNGWELSSGIDQSEPLQEHLNALAKITESKKTAMASLCSKYEGQLSCAIYTSLKDEQNFVPIYISREFVKLIGDLGLEANFEVYTLP